MIRELYAPNHRRRRDQAVFEANNRCQRCGVYFGRMKVSRAHNLCFEMPHLHHPNNDPENPDAVIEVLCDACHMRAHRQRTKTGKATPKKTGYEVVRLPYLLDQLQAVGLVTWKTDDGHIGWQVGTLSSQADTALEALAESIHWMVGEIRDLEDKLQRQAARSSAGGVR